jgi:hypothetical protein
LRILAIDKHVSRHENISNLLSTQFEHADITIVEHLKNYHDELGINNLVLVHVGNTVDYNIVFRKKLKCIVIYYTGQFDVIDVEGNVIFSPYDELEQAIEESGKIL